MIERQELFCHDCQNYIQFNVDLSLTGNHIFKCPRCQHEHCRVVMDGKITDIRWDQRNMTYFVSPWSISVSTSSTTTGTFLNQCWANSIESTG